MKFTYKIELSFYKSMVRAFQIVNKETWGASSHSP